MKSKGKNLFESALMSIGKQLIMPKKLECLFNLRFSRLIVNSAFYIDGVVGQEAFEYKILRFNGRDTENFLGVEFNSDKLYVSERSKDGSEHFLDGRITITYHRDIDVWTAYLHLLSKEDEINRIVEIDKVKDC